MRVPLALTVAVALMATPAIAYAQSSITGSAGSSPSTPEDPNPADPTPEDPAPVTPPLDFNFTSYPYSVVELPVEQAPYHWPFVNPLEPPIQDFEGIAMSKDGEQLANHPVLQAQYMLVRLNSYRRNQDPAFLERVERHAARLMDYSVDVGDATFLPYPFDFPVHGRDPLEAPWYSGMAQGQALSAFVRLFEVTGDQKYKDFANRLFVSLTQHKDADDSDVPWVTIVDDAGYLWFEEYAKGDYGDFTYNGHMYAVMGLYDYYRLSGDPVALQLYQGGMTTVRQYAQEIRNPGDVSSYCLVHPDVKSKSYHEVHIRELRLFSRMTGDQVFDQIATQFRQDYTP